MKVWCLGKNQGQKEGYLYLSSRDYPTIPTFGTNTSFSGWLSSSVTRNSTTLEISKRFSMLFHWLEVWYPSSWSPSFGSTTMPLRTFKWLLWKNFIVIKKPRSMELDISSRSWCILSWLLAKLTWKIGSKPRSITKCIKLSTIISLMWYICTRDWSM